MVMSRLVALCLVSVASSTPSEKEDFDRFLRDFDWGVPSEKEEAHEKHRVDPFFDSGKHYADSAVRYADNVTEHLHHFVQDGLEHASKEAKRVEKAGEEYAKDAREATKESLAQASKVRHAYAGNVTERVHELVEHNMEKSAKQAKDMRHQGLHYAKRAHDVAQKRVAQAEDAQDKFSSEAEKMQSGLSVFDPAMGMVSFLAEEDEAWHNSSEVAQALAAQHSAAHQAQEQIDELKQWDEKLKADLKNKNFSRHVASGIVAKVQTSFVERRAKLHASFDAAIDALTSDSLDVTNKTAVDDATDAVEKVAHELHHLDHLESKAMHSTLHSIEKAGKRKARSMWKVARKAAHEAYHSGMAVAKAQRKAGAREHVYERTQGRAEKVSEHLLGHAEHAAEHGEDLVEDQFDKVEHHLEHIMDDVAHQSKHQRESRMHRARQHVHERKEAAEAAAKAKEAAEAAAKTTSEVKKPAQEHPASAFLAKRESSDLSLTLLAPLACVMGLGAVSFALLASRIWRQGPVAEQPLLG